MLNSIFDCSDPASSLMAGSFVALVGIYARRLGVPQLDLSRTLGTRGPLTTLPVLGPLMVLPPWVHYAAAGLAVEIACAGGSIKTVGFNKKTKNALVMGFCGGYGAVVGFSIADVYAKGLFGIGLLGPV